MTLRLTAIARSTERDHYLATATATDSESGATIQAVLAWTPDASGGQYLRCVASFGMPTAWNESEQTIAVVSICEAVEGARWSYGDVSI